MQLPEEFLDSLKGLRGFNKEAFEKVHSSGEQVTSIRINPRKWSMVNACSPERKGEWTMVDGQCLPAGQAGSIGDNRLDSYVPLTRTEVIHHSPLPDEVLAKAGLTIDQRVPWTQYGFYLSKRPSFTFDPMFHAGCYYVQEASSMFLEQALKQSIDLSRPLKILDLCAAPGGKSTHILSLISSESLIVSNEVIKSRAAVLRDNITKWGHSNVVVTCSDPKNFQRLENYFDVIVVDAPCSGSGLFRREPEAIEEWSLGNVQLCSRRQQRILTDVLPALKKGGIMIYSTCSYSKEENEDIGRWMMEEHKMESEEIKTEKDWAIVQSEMGYRFYPDKLKGEGFFLACFRKTDGKETASDRMRDKPQKISSAETQLIANWIKAANLNFILHDQTVHAIPPYLRTDIRIISNHIHVISFGTIIGEMIRDKVVPDHALAMSGLVSDHILRMELDHDQAIRYLKKKEINVKIEKTGWHLIMHQGQPLGWMNVLPGRMNNYYPKELRILKD